MKLIGWGAAEYYHPGKKNNIKRSGAYDNKGPEYILGVPYYSYSLDIWATGATFAEFILGKKLFKGEGDSRKTLHDIGALVGTDELIAYMDKYDIKLNRKFKTVI